MRLNSSRRGLSQTPRRRSQDRPTAQWPCPTCRVSADSDLLSAQEFFPDLAHGLRIDVAADESLADAARQDQSQLAGFGLLVLGHQLQEPLDIVLAFRRRDRQLKGDEMIAHFIGFAVRAKAEMRR